MRFMRGATLALVLALLAPLSGAQAELRATPLIPAAAAEPTDGYIFAAGGTPYSNGLFFPGTTFCSAGGCETLGPPARVAKGTDVTFTNVDVGVVAGAHQIISRKKNKKTKRPLFASKSVDGPGQVTMKTSHLKPGEYLYYCSIHFGMDGTLEVYKP